MFQSNSSAFSLDTSTISIHRGVELSASLVHPAYRGHLELSVSAYRGGVVHFRVAEANPFRPRSSADTVVLQSNLEPLELSWNGAEKRLEFDGNKAISISKSFVTTISMDDEPLAIINGRGSFLFDWLRDPSSSGGAKSDDWSEKFRTFTDTRPRGPESVGLDFSFPGTTHVYGIPEHADSMSLRDTRDDHGVQSDPYRLFNLDVFEYQLNSKMALYGSVPFAIAHGLSGTTGVFWNNAAETWVDVSESHHAAGGGKQLHWFSEAGIIDAYILIGRSPSDVMSQYAMLVGTTTLPPLFSLGYHQCRWNYNDQEDVNMVDRHFDMHNIPYDVLWLDIEHTDAKKYFTFDTKKFPDPQGMIDAISSRGRKMVAIVDPHIKVDNSYSVFKSGSSEDVFIKSSGGGDFTGWCWPGNSRWPDFFDERVRHWWGDLFALDEYHGSTRSLYIWNDMNEPSVFSGPEVSMPRDAIHLDGREHREVHNLYGQEFHRATVEGLMRRTLDRNERPFVLSRAFYAGTQRYGPVWTGDNAATWGHLSMATPMLLTLGISGITFSGADVGGFFGDPSPQLLARWYQAGAFYPFFRAHSHLETKRREPWLFGERYTSIIRNAIRRRYQLLPTYYTLFHENALTGMPVMRPMWVEFPQDAATFAMDDQFLIGRSILVKPVVRKDAASVRVYLPRGGGTETRPEKWYHYHDGSSAASLGMITLDVTMEDIPVYVRGGAIVVRKDRPRRSSAHMRNDPYTLLIAKDAEGNAAGSLYVDDGHSFAYTRGQYALRTFSLQSNELRMEVAHHSPRGVMSIGTHVERIIILGVEEEPEEVVAVTPPPSRASGSIEYTYQADAKRLVLRKPPCGMDEPDRKSVV